MSSVGTAITTVKPRVAGIACVDATPFSFAGDGASSDEGRGVSRGKGSDDPRVAAVVLDVTRPS
jgi:hypothetical protein